MEVTTIEARDRVKTGKGAARRLRAELLVPAICYGRHTKPLAIAVDPRALKAALDPTRGFNTVLKLKTPTSETLVLVRDYQVDAIRRDFIHVDFIAVQENEPLHVEVPLVLTGKSPGVKDGGILQQIYRKLDVQALPFAIPAKLEVDVSNLGLGDSIHLSEINLPEGVKCSLDPKTTICSVVIPREEKATAAEESAAADAAASSAAAPVAGAKAAAPAAGGKAAPGGKAAAPAAGGDKKPAAKK